MVKAKIWIFKKHFEGCPKDEDFELAEEELPELKDGEFLAEALYLSVDPYMRAYSSNQPLGKPLLGGQLAVIRDSKNPTYPTGKHIVAGFGWRTHTISDGSARMIPISFVPDFGDLPLSLGLGILGRVGNSALFGFLELCQPKPGEIVVVSGAAGAVGSLVGQIAKIKGCKVIGIAGSDEKGKWLTEELDFDNFINYKTQDVKQALIEAAPTGVDCYFDNVGGEISSIVLRHMNNFGRVSVCGAISGYNNKEGATATTVQGPIISKQLKMEGFIVSRWQDRFEEGIMQNLQWIKKGKLKYKETVTVGFDNMVKAFQDMLKGKNLGKAIVKV